MVELAETLASIAEEEARHDDGLHRRLWSWVDRTARSQRAVAAMLGVSPAALSGYKLKTYDGDLVRLEAKIQQLLDREEPLTPPLGPEYIETQVALELMDLLAFCEEERHLGLAYGPAGSGKSCAVAMYKARKRSTIVLTASPQWRSADCVLRGIAHSCGCFADENSLADRLKHSRQLVVIDEAQHLQFGALEQARWLYDSARIGVVMVGTDDLLRSVQRRHFEQLRSRALSQPLGHQIPAEDVDRFLDVARPGLSEPARAYLKREANASGRLRRVQKLLEVARVLARGEEVTLAMLKKASVRLMA